MKTPREKYLNDSLYKALVDSLHSCIEAGNFTPSEVREAAIFACIIYEEQRIQPLGIKVPKDIDNALTKIRGWASSTSF